MKKQKFFGAMTAVTLFCLGLTACGGSDDVDLTQLIQQTPVVTTTDPAGTVEVNFKKGSSANEQSVGVGKIYVDNAGNFTSDPGPWNEVLGYYKNGQIEFASVGKVNGLSSVLSIPSDGWSNSVAVTAGTGYIVHNHNHNSYSYTRMYVVSVSSTSVTVKYQYPFSLPFIPIKLKQTKFNVDSSEQYIEAELMNRTSFNIVSSPDWCSNSFNVNVCSYYDVNVVVSSIIIPVQENTTGQNRTGEIVLKNDVSSAKITIVQEG